MGTLNTHTGEKDDYGCLPLKMQFLSSLTSSELSRTLVHSVAGRYVANLTFSGPSSADAPAECAFGLSCVLQLEGTDLLFSRLALAVSPTPATHAISTFGRVYQALHIDSKSVLDALCRVKKCLRRSV